MAFQVSPGVNVSEIDLTTVVPAVSTTEAAISGPFRWGPVDERVLISSEENLVQRFGKPTSTNAETFFTAANFLSYGNKLYVVRAARTANGTNIAKAENAAYPANSNGILIKNDDDYENNYNNGISGMIFAAKYPGELGNSISVSTCDTGTAFESTVANVSIANGATTVSTTGDNFSTKIGVGDLLYTTNNDFIGKVSSITDTENLELETAYVGETQSNITSKRRWGFWQNVVGAPGTSAAAQAQAGLTANDEMHIVVYDSGGTWTGTRNTVLEVFEKVSKAADARTPDGSTNYYKNVINDRSQYIWWLGHDTGGNKGTNLADATFGSTLFGGSIKPAYYALGGGRDGGVTNATITESNIIGSAELTGNSRGYGLFRSAEDVDVSLILAGKARGGTNGEGVPNYIIDNICDVRKDCVAFISPDRADVVNNETGATNDSITFRNSLTSTSYAVLDSGYKYQYDKYNDVYRYIPLNGDVAGTCVRTDLERDAWFSPAGYNRGGIKNIVKLANNPDKANRDLLYQSDINPVVTFPGQGTLLFGDKTLLGQPSAFDRINVRRLFIVLEKAISTAAKFSLFEFNDEFTRAQFKNLVEPFLRDVQGRRGIFDFKVVCDESNNTGEVIDRNEFVGDIYVKPARSINFIQLNFVAVRTGVEFSEVVGQF